MKTILSKTQEVLPAGEDSFKVIAQLIPQLLWIATPEGKHEYYNDRWYEYTGSTFEEIQKNGWKDILHPEDKDKTDKAWAKSIKTGKPFEAEFRLKHGKSGEYRWFLSRAMPIHDSKGKIIKWLATGTDVDIQKNNQNNLIYLAEASRTLSSSLDYKKTLKKVAELAVPEIADWCSIDMLQEDGTLKNLAVAHKDPAKVKWAKELQKKFPVKMDAPTGVPNVLRTGKTEYYPVITQEMIDATQPTKEERELLDKLGLYSVIIVPICIQDKTIGAISFISAESGRYYTKADLSTAEELASRASLAINNAILYENLKASNKKFQRLVDSNIVGVFTSTYDGTFLDANDIFLKLIGYTREELKKGLIMRDALTPPEQRVLSQDALVSLKKYGSAKPYEKEYISKTGKKTPVLIGVADLDGKTCIGFVVDISERKELERRKDEFIGIASHELKTPLTSIKGYTQILERIIQQMGDEKASMYLNKTNKYINRLNSLIADLLDVSKIQAGKLQFNVEKFKFQELVREGIESAQIVSDRHKIVLEGDVDTEITGDRHRLEQVFNNLLANAIKYSPKSNEVRVKVKRINGVVKVAIQDKGIGIPKKHQGRLFERFYRAETSAKQFSGLGIGLYISSEIVKRHNGDIWVESEEGKGSTFYFTLPVKSPFAN